jgi:hypothetical protein
MDILLLPPLIAMLPVSWGTVIVWRGKSRLTHRAELQGTAARLTGGFFIVCGIAILAAMYWARLCALAVHSR